MKKLILTNKNQWTEFKYENNDSQAFIQTKINDLGKFSFYENVKTPKTSPSEKDSLRAQQAYISNIPEIKEQDNYQLISASIFLTEHSVKGIINFRLNGVHQQIRF